MLHQNTLNWEPDTKAISFMSGLISLMKDGGIWQVPMNGNVYKVDHKAKVFTLIEGRLDDVFYKSDIVARLLGYRFEVGTDCDLKTGTGKTGAAFSC